MKAAEAINVLSAAGSDYALATAELDRRKELAKLEKEQATDKKALIQSEQAFEKEQLERQRKIDMLKAQGSLFPAQAQANRINARAADGQTGGQVVVNQVDASSRVDSTQTNQGIVTPKELGPRGRVEQMLDAVAY